MRYMWTENTRIFKGKKVLIIEKFLFKKKQNVNIEAEASLCQPSLKVHSQNCGFPGSMYIRERWTIKDTEHWRADAFKLWCWRRLLGVPWTAKGSNQSILKEINPAYSLERLMLKLYLMLITGHLMQTANSLEKTLNLEVDLNNVGNHHPHRPLCTCTQRSTAGLSPHVWLLIPWEKWWRVKLGFKSTAK